MRLSRAAVPAALLAALLVGGCRAAPDATDRGAERSPTTGSASTGADPLSDIDPTLDAVERDLDADAAG